MDGLAPDAAALFERAQQIFADRAKRYGTENIHDTGPSGVLARIRDKIARAENLLDEGTPEMAVDTALDLANYGIILASLVSGTWPNERKTCLVRAPGDSYISAPQMEGDVGFDLRASKETVIPCWHPTYVPTGVHLAMPEGVWCTLVGRSSLLRTHQAMVPTCVIDTGYTGQLEVCIVNMNDRRITIEEGERIAQVVFHKSVVPQLEVVDELPQTDRGDLGFGSTGK